MMNIKNNIAVWGALLALLTSFSACQSEQVLDVPIPEKPAYTVGEADNAIRLMAGISEGGSGVQTRVGAEDNHSSHVSLIENTKMRLQVIGEWWKTADATSGDQIIKTSVATAGALVTSTDDKHRTLSFDPVLYWDDYGTADPSNTPEERGRKKGLTIYGVAVDGVTTAPTVNDGQWTALPWNVGDPSGTPSILDQSLPPTYWKDKDLLISNNVKEGTSDGTYKFDDNPRSKLLEFTHAMSKITVRLIASDGFLATDEVGSTTNKFQNIPEVVLTSNEGTASTNNEWPYTSGNVDITTGNVSSQSGPAKVKMHTQSTTDATYTAIYDALVMPGSCFGATDDAIIARINADDNIYYVTAKEIRTKMQADNSSTDYKTASGKNYVITVNVKKTKIDVTATIADWENVTSETVNPVINISASYGESGTALGKESFSFYRSKAMNTGYSSGISPVNGYTPSEAVVKKPTSPATEWDFTDGYSNPKPLYWTDHNTHYQMRGVWPLTSTENGKESFPHVSTVTHEYVEYQVIQVKNAPYAQGTFPSDLAIGRPNVATDATCHNSDHEARNLFSDGICATEGTVNLDFEYMMSQVEVNLSTSEGDDKVTLTNAMVEVTKLHTTGDVKLGDRGVIPTGTKSDVYALTSTSTANQFKNAIVPQELTYSTEDVQKANNVRFKITIYKNGNVSDGVDDIYYADVNPILETGKTTKIAPNGKWESGKHYVYNLKLSKTKIDVTATFKDWVTVNATENVWF